MKQRKPIAPLAPLMILILAGCSDGQVSKEELPAPAREAAPAREVIPVGDEATSVTVAKLAPAEPGPSVAAPKASAAAPEAPAAAPEAPAAAPVIQVSIRGMAFVPSRIDITAGTTVTWKNEDDVPHTVTATDGSWDSGVIAPGGTFSRRFAGAGTFAFLCVPHPDMTGSVVVRARE